MDATIACRRDMDFDMLILCLEKLALLKPIKAPSEIKSSFLHPGHQNLVGVAPVTSSGQRTTFFLRRRDGHVQEFFACVQVRERSPDENL